MDLGDKEKKAIASSKKAAFLTLFGFIIFFASIVYSVFQLNQLENKKADMENEIQGMEMEMIEKRAELDKVISELDFSIRQHDSLRTLLSMNEFDLAKKQAAREIEPRVYIHVLNNSFVEEVERLTAMLKERGFLVPKKDIYVDDVPPTTQVRFFYDNEIDEAEFIVMMLKNDFGIKDAHAEYFDEFKRLNITRPRNYEIWLGKNLFRQRQAMVK